MTWPTKTNDGRPINRVLFDALGDAETVRALFADIDAVDAVALLITRHPERAAEMWPATPDSISSHHNYHRPNVWLVIECHTQAEYNAAVKHLRALRPLCGVVGVYLVPRELIGMNEPWANGLPYLTGFDWLAIAGGEDPTHPDWVRGPIAQAVEAAVPVAFGGSEWGEWTGEESPSPSHRFADGTPMVRCYGERSGRTIDGREWSEVPG